MTDWQLHAACRGQDPAMFFPPKGGQDPYFEAKKFCARCLVRGACLTYAMEVERGWDMSRRYGMYGGLNPKQRAARAGYVRSRVAA